MESDMSFLQMMLGGNQNKKTISLTPDDFTSKNLEQKELEKIVSMYGVEIEDIYDLSAGQKWMFRKVKSVKTTFFLQVMLKALIKLDPAEFRAKVDCRQRLGQTNSRPASPSVSTRF